MTKIYLAENFLEADQIISELEANHIFAKNMKSSKHPSQPGWQNQYLKFMSMKKMWKKPLK